MATPTSLASSGKTLLRGQHETPGKRGPVLPAWVRSSCLIVSPNGDSPPSEVQGNECRGELGTQFCVRSQVIPAPAMGHHLGPQVPKYKALEDREQLAGKRTPSPPSPGLCTKLSAENWTQTGARRGGKGAGGHPAFYGPGCRNADSDSAHGTFKQSWGPTAPLNQLSVLRPPLHGHPGSPTAGRWTSQIQGAGNRGVLAGWLKPMLALALEPEQGVGS